MSTNILRVYVAGPYSADNVLDVLKNIGRGEKLCATLFVMGFSPFCPWHDKSYVIDCFDTEFTVEQFYKHTMAWLEVSDCVLVLPGWASSTGTIAETNRAIELGKPLFYSIEELVIWRDSHEQTDK